jgi:death-on-curing protein
MMRYLTISELVYINGKILNNAQIISGKQQIRDMALLDAAANRPAASAFGEDAYPFLNEKVAALFHSLARNHPFTDGNKRTATVAAIFMFEVNGQRVVWQPDEALTMIISVAEGQRDLYSLAQWFPLEAAEPSLEENEEKDMISITRIIEEHRWVLDELASR